MNRTTRTEPTADPKANPAPRTSPGAPPDESDLDRLWTEAVIEGEIKQLANLPEENINKPGSVFSICLLKIASAAKGTGAKHVGQDDALQQIMKACPQHIPEKEIRRQWKRAWDKAKPRYRKKKPRSRNGSGPAPAGKEKKSRSPTLTPSIRRRRIT